MPKPREYICKYCDRSFVKRHNVLNHIRNIHVATTCFCDICEEKFTSPAALKQHLARGHNRFRQGNPECELCGKIFTRREGIITHLMVTHSAGAKPPEHSCKLCNKKFTNAKNLKAHIRKLHKTNLNYPTCVECNKVFRGKQTLVAHVQAVHQVAARDTFTCHLCEKLYINHENLKRHLLDFHGLNDDYRCSICSKVFGSNSDLTQHLNTSHLSIPEQFTCEHCSRVFPEKTILDAHISVNHSRDRLKSKYTCECDKAFSSESLLRQHLKSAHTVEVFYSYCKNFLLKKTSREAVKATNPDFGHHCDMCQEYFGSLYGLGNHMKEEHDLQLSVETCNVCFTIFYSMDALTQHQKICVDPNNVIQCSKCDKVFTHKSIFDLHVEMFHYTPEKPSTPVSDEESEDEAINDLKCKYCDETFKTKFIVQKHIDHVHLGMQRFRCLDCGSQFKEKRNLRKHIRLKHVLSSTFARCQFCQKRFESAKACTIHLKQVHSFETITFPCDICSTSCKTNDALTLHMKKKHAEDKELFKCEKCSILFKGYESFERHSQKCQENMASTSERVPRCVICMKDFCTEKSLKRHIRLFHKGFNGDKLVAIGYSKRSFAVNCEDCSKMFTSRETYRIYLKNKKMSDAIVFKCTKCGDTYNVIEFAVQRYKKTMKVQRKRASRDSGDEAGGSDGSAHK